MKDQLNGIRGLLIRVGDALYRPLWALWTRTALGRHANAAIEWLPTRPRRWIVQRKRNVRGWQAGLGLRLREGRDAPLVPERELERTYQDALMLLASETGSDGVGDYLEFGVYVGTSLLCMHRASKAVGLGSLRLFGFDSFQGLPEAAATEDEGRFRPGWFRAEYDLVREHLTQRGIDWNRTVLVPGWFEDTLNPELARRLGIEKAGVIMIDCDIYSSARTALDFCAPLIKDRAVVVFDDWPGDTPEAKVLGERRAFDEFLADNPDLTAEEREPYQWEGRAHFNRGKVFLVTRTRSESPDARLDDIVIGGHDGETATAGA